MNIKQKRLKIAIVLLVIAIAAVIFVRVVVAERSPEVGVVSTLLQKRGETNLYDFTIRIAASPMTYVWLSIETNGRIIEAQPNIVSAVSGLGTKTIARVISPSIFGMFESVRHLELTITAEVDGELHYNITVNTFFGSKEVGT